MCLLSFEYKPKPTASSTTDPRLAYSASASGVGFCSGNGSDDDIEPGFGTELLNAGEGAPVREVGGEE